MEKVKTIKKNNVIAEVCCAEFEQAINNNKIHLRPVMTLKGYYPIATIDKKDGVEESIVICPFCNKTIKLRIDGLPFL